MQNIFNNRLYSTVTKHDKKERNDGHKLKTIIIIRNRRKVNFELPEWVKSKRSPQPSKAETFEKGGDFELRLTEKAKNKNSSLF